MKTWTTMTLGLALIAASVAPALAQPAGVTESQIKSATTAADHQAIADAYTKEAESLRAEADKHRHMDSWYSEPAYRAKSGITRHCRALTQHFEAAAKEADSLAAAHHAMAQQAEKAKK